MSDRVNGPKKLSPAEIRAAIPRLVRRVAELEKLPLSEAFYGDATSPTAAALDHAITSTVADIFGSDSWEYRYLAKPFLRSMAEGNKKGIKAEQERAIALLKQKIALLEEQLQQNDDDAASRAIRAYGDLDLHPEIGRAASDLYRDEHYANAIEDAVKALNALVRLRSGVELDGAQLMTTVFSPKDPILRFNDLADQSDKDEQQGFMMMFAGAVAGLRNPRAHKLIKDDPERALEFIAFVSLLAKLLDGARKA